MAQENQPDRQKHTRIEFNSDVTIYPVHESKSENILEVPSQGITVRGRDLSEGGIRLDMGLAKSATDIMKVNFKVKKLKPVDAYAKLVWKKGSLFGFRYIFLDEDSRRNIRTYVNEQTQKK